MSATTQHTGDVGVSPTSPSDSSLRVPQELIDRIVEHVAAPLRDSEGRLILLKDEQAAADLITLTLVPKFEAGSSRVLLGQLIIGDATRTVSDFAKAVKDSTRLARAITSLNIDLRDCDIHRSASIESLEIILARLHNLVKLRIHDSQGNTRPSLRRHAAKTEQTDESLKLSGKIQDLALSALDIDAVLQCLGLFDQITELNLENIFCSSVPLFGLSEDVALPRLAVKTLNLTGCHPAVAGLLSKIINTQHPVDTIGLYDVSFALEYRALRHLLRAIGRDTVDVTLELTNRLAKNPNSVPPKVIFSALADFWQLRSLHLYEDSEVEDPEALLFFSMIPHLPSDLHRFRLILRYYQNISSIIEAEVFSQAIQDFLARYPRLSSFDISVDLREYANPVDPATEASEAVEKLKGRLSPLYRDRVSFITPRSPYYVDLTHQKFVLGTL